MTTTHELPQPGPDPTDPEDALRALRLALEAAGITLPDLQVEGCTCGALMTPPLVELGNVKPEVAFRLAEIIAAGARP